MVPYIIINGVSSKNINGLLIQSLPPISKPKIRLTTEEIDGRDGDVVTVNGYAAYDKAITIGLKGEYNVDDVIEYFNTSGIITFSNELDKYYKFAIYDVIDFNKLIRFKTATVKMHVQPFKYSIDEPPILWENEGAETIAHLPVVNKGNTYSKPLLTIEGSNTITVYIDNKQILSINLDGAGETIIIDPVAMNALTPNGDFLNRKVTGDYKNFRLKPGTNNIRITGAVDTITLETVSRWI